MTLGIGSYTYPWSIGVPGFPSPARPLDHKGLLSRAIHHGVQTVQFCDNLPLTQLSSEALGKLHGQAQGAGIQIEVGTRGLDTQEFSRCVAIAQQVGSPFVRLVVDFHKETSRVEILAGFAQQCEGAGTLLAIENHDSTPSKSLLDLAQEIGPVGFCLDTANSLGALEDLPRVLGALGPRTVNLHVKDIRIDRLPHMMGFHVQGTPAGQGMVPIAETLAELAGYGFDGSVTLEHWPPEKGEDLEEGWTEASLAFLRPLVTG